MHRPRDIAVVALQLALALCPKTAAHGQTLRAPELASGQSLELPSPEGAANEPARVLLELEVSATGSVRASRVIEIEGASADTERLTAAALVRAAQLRFIAAQRGGENLAANIRVELRFVPTTPTAQAPLASVPEPAPIAESAPISEPVPVPESEPVPGPVAPPSSAPAPHAHSHPHVHVHAHSPETFGAHARIAGRASPARTDAASELDIDLSALRDVPRRRAEQYLTLAPGLVLQNHSGAGHTSSIFVRGFDAGEGEDLQLTVDGIPLNEPSNAHVHGYADTLFLIPEVIDRVRVLEGPFDPRQGDFAIAGSAGYELGVEERGLRGQLEYGRFAERRALLLWAPEDATRGTFAAVDMTADDGFARNRAAQNFRAMGRYASEPGPLQFSLLGAAQAGNYDSAGIVRGDDFAARRLPCPPDRDSQFFCLYDPNQGGSTSRALLSGALRWQRPGRAFLLQSYLGRRQLRIRDNFTGYLLDPRGDGLEQRYDATTFGLHSSYAFELRAFERTQRFELGVEARHDSAHTSMWRLRREEAVPFATVFDNELGLNHGALFLRAELTPAPWFAVVAGLRADAFAFSSLDLAAPESDRSGERLPVRGSDAFGATLSPRGSLHFALTDQLSWVVSGGVGVRSSDAQALSEGEAAPFARAIATETGPRFTLERPGGLRIEASAFAFATRVQQDLVFDAERGRNVPIGASNRYGAGGTARLRLSDLSDTLASFTWAEARVAEEDAAFYELAAGEVLPFVPRAVMRIDHAGYARFALGGERLRAGFAFGLSFIGPRPLPLGTFSETVWNLDASVRARWRMFELAFELENLLDARNRVAEFNHPSNFDDPDEPASLRAVRHFAAGPPRRWLLTLTVYFDERDLALGEKS